MSAPSTSDGSEDVNDFLQRIKELGDKRDQEDEERNRKLEEEILQGRKERQARRAERARSISPTKSSPANTPTTSRVSASQANTLSQAVPPTIDPPRDSEPQRETALDDAMDRLTGNSSSTMKENASPFDNIQDDVRRNVGMKVSPSSAMPSRNSPLSWQRRPNSQASDRPRSRPLSMVATENATRSPRATPEPTSATEPTFSREQIAQNLAGKDPAWFRQTADRGQNSPAYRKNLVEDEDRSEHGSSSTRIQMPGMSREASQGDKATEESADRSSSPSSSSTANGSSSRASYQPGTKAITGFGSPMPLTQAQKLEPPLDSRSESRSLAMSPSQGRISPERLDRPPSPTKGMGGFVQSAMMKRSDSVSKRWSVQSPPGLTRGNSVTSNRSSVDTSSSLALGGTTARPVSLSRENSPRPSSRPTSSHSNATVTQDRPGTSNSMRSSTTTSTRDDGFIKPSLPASKIQTPIGIKIGQGESSVQTPTQGETTPPSSPSKTMDPRRWSPTKSSWLESALNKPESPKPKSVAPPQQPAWLSEINKVKQKASVDQVRTTPAGPKHEVSIGGLMRSPPPGGLAKPSSIGGLPTSFSSGPVSKSRPESVASQASSESLNPLKSPDSSASNTMSPTSSAAVAKVKPETPPKKDFRAGLKSRQPPPDTSQPKEPEFKNVFGQLRRTKTQNFVAPDELKDNITRGKAALSLTGGPKKTERKDEFKEAILKKKDDFKKAQLEGKGVARSTSGVSQEAPLPEALARRRALGRSGSIVGESESATSDSPSRLSSISDSPKPSFVKETSAPGRLQAKEPAVGKLAGRLNPGLADMLARGPPPVLDDSARSANPSFSRSMAVSSASTTDTPEAGPQLTHMTKCRARGPRRKAPSNAPVNAIAGSDPEVLPDPKPLPKADLKSPQQTPPQGIRTTVPVRAPVQEFPLKVNTETSNSQPSSPRKLDMKRRSQFLRESPTKTAVAEPYLDSPKPLSPTKKSNLTEISVKPGESPSVLDSPLATRIKPDTPVKSTSLSSKTTSPAISPTESPETARLRPSPLPPTKPATYNQESNVSSPNPSPLDTAKLRPSPLPPYKILMNNENFETPLSQRKKAVDLEHGKITSQNSGSVSVKNAAALFSSSTNSVQSPRARSPIKLPTHEDEKMAMIGAGLRSPSPTKERGLQIAPAPRPLPTPPVKSVVSPPFSGGLSPSSDPSQTISDFFSDRAPSKDFMVDTATLLASRPDQGENIKTLRASLCQISLEGKKQPVPAHQERILFEENLYLCNHTFGNSAGKKVTEVYFWYGDFVSKNIVDQVEVFAQREARSAGGKLVTIKQGKETPEFFHALGGIIIIRRGSSNKYDSLAPHILCCRKHIGQIVFDEVDFAPTSLCSGFPYLISTQSGKSYLWKGKGTGIEELGCARLIGMDFGLTGEVEEVEDGSESASFLNIFGAGATIPKSADHWRMKPNYNHYLHRLFLADSKSKEQIIEIKPFCQADLDWSKIFILDAFFEMYIIIGSNAQSEYASFQHALLFAQEYGILAAGMEDRPFIPITTVVLEGVPKDMRSVFRKWVPELSPTTHNPPASSLQRGRSLRVLPLNAALGAIRN